MDAKTVKTTPKANPGFSISGAIADLSYKVPGVDVAGIGLGFRRNLRAGDEIMTVLSRSITDPARTEHSLSQALENFSTAQALVGKKCGVERHMHDFDAKIESNLHAVNGAMYLRIGEAIRKGEDLQRVLDEVLVNAFAARKTGLATPDVPKTRFGIPVPDTSRKDVIDAVCNRVADVKAITTIWNLLKPVYEAGSTEQRGMVLNTLTTALTQRSNNAVHLGVRQY